MNTFTQRALLNKLRDAKKRQKKNGFTLVELLIVVIILGVLTSVALPSLLGTRDKADKNASFASTLGMAQECSNALLIDTATADLPKYKSNELVTVSGLCSDTATTTYATVELQTPKAGDLCINDPAEAGENRCTVSVTKDGDKSGAWSTATSQG